MDHKKAEASGLNVKFWDFLFYASFGFVVTSSVSIAGVLLVFCYLIVPSVAAMLYADTIGKRLAIGWSMGTIVSALGVYPVAAARPADRRDDRAMPTVAATSAGASLTPSPIMATRRVFASSSMRASFTSGNKSVSKSSTSNSRAICSVAARESPVREIGPQAEGFHVGDCLLGLGTWHIGKGDRAERVDTPHHEYGRRGLRID